MLLGLWFLLWTPSALAAPTPPAPVDMSLSLVLVGDLSGYLSGFRCTKRGEKRRSSSSGLSHLLAQVQRIRQERSRHNQPAPLVFTTGDILAPRQDMRFLLSQPDPKGTIFLADLLQAFGFSLIGIGNHEFSVPLQQLDRFLQYSRRNALQFSAANVLKAVSHHPFHGVINRDVHQKKRAFFLFRTDPRYGPSLRIAAFHLIPQEMPVAPRRIRGLQVAPPLERARSIVRSIQALKPPVDLVVVLSHLGESYAPNTKLKALARDVPGIDIILTNSIRDSKTHTRSLIYSNKQGQNVYIIGGSKYGHSLQRVDVTLRKRPGQKALLHALRVRRVTTQPGRYDATWKARIQRWQKVYCKETGKQLGRGRIPPGKSMTYDNFLMYTLNLMRLTTGSELAVLNQGAVRHSPFPLQHTITHDDLYRALPYNTKLVVVKLKGKELLRWLQPKPDDPEASPEEMTFAGWDAKKKTVNGRPVEPQKFYQFVTIDFVVERRRRRLLQRIAQISAQVAKKPLLASALAKAQSRLRWFDSRWHIPVKKGCHKIETLSSVCDFRCCYRLRSQMRQHFATDAFRHLPSAGKTASSPTHTWMIPYQGQLLHPEERFAWSLNTEVALNFDSNFISPIDLVGPRTYARVPTDFFTQYQFSGLFRLNLNAGTLSHQWDTQFQLLYGAYIRSQATLQEQGDMGIAEIFDEVNDQIQLITQYRYTRLRWFRPLVRAELQTELTRRGRPNLTDDEYVQALSQIRYRSFSLEGEVGFEMDAIPKHLTLGVSFNARKEFALQQYPAPGTPAAARYPDVIGLPDTNFLPGLVLQYRTSKLLLFQWGRRATTFESLGKYILRASVPVDLPDAQVLLIHEIELDNILSFTLNAYLSFALRFKAVFYKGTLQQDSRDARRRIPGPWAFWLTPSALVRFQWGTRGQSL